MACPQIYSGVSFLGSTLAYVDCQAQSVGAFGFQALSAPNSTGAAVLGGMLTLFIAIFGYRLLLGYAVHGHDVVSAVLKIGIVLTLATSWVTVRTLVYDTVLYGPAEIAATITGTSDLSSRYALVDRLENVDAGIIAVTAAGTGRGDGDEAEGSGPIRATGQAVSSRRAAFAGVAVDDTLGLGLARVAYLAGTLVPLVALRIAAGLLIALTPIIAGLLLFEGTQGIFFGWVRALVLVALGSLAVVVSLSFELTLLQPWLSDVLSRRAAQLVTPAAPTELLVMTVTFATVAFVLLYLLVRAAFHPGAVVRLVQGARDRLRERERPAIAAVPDSVPSSESHRAAQIAERLTTIHRGERSLGRDEGAVQLGQASGGRGTPMADDEPASPLRTPQAPLGSSYRRSSRRSSAAAITRDRH